MRQEHRGHLGIPNLDKIGRPIPLANDALNSARERQRGRGKEQESEREREREREKERERERERERAAPISHAPIHAKQVQKWFLLVAHTQRT